MKRIAIRTYGVVLFILGFLGTVIVLPRITVRWPDTPERVVFIALLLGVAGGFGAAAFVISFFKFISKREEEETEQASRPY